MRWVSVKRPRRQLATLSALGEATELYVVQMDPEKAQVAMLTSGPQLIVEEDAYLTYGAAQRATHLPPPMASVRALQGEGALGQPIKLRIVGEGDSPVANASVQLQSIGLTPSEGKTDEKGEATLNLITQPGDHAQYIMVNPADDYWNYYNDSPQLSRNRVNVIRLQSLRETISGFPDRFRFGWGQRLMGLDQIPDEFTGQGVKVAVIDSGCGNQNPLLQHVQQGEDLTNNQDPTTWANDIVGHGTHCAGVITARDNAGTSLRGFVPEAEIHILKIFPGGAFSNLLDALDYCIDHEIDVVNMSLGSPQISEAVEQKLEEAVENGVACIVAAGNSGGPVHYPASSRYALAVSALGKVGEFPQKTWESQQIQQELLDQRTGLFFPQFTCYGPQVKVCAPGVAVISTVPGNGFDPESGTSMAAPHVTGLAALLLAHLPEFKRGGIFGARNAQRVGRVYQRIQGASRPLTELFGRERVLWTGAGLPTLHSVVQEMQSTTTQPAAIPPSEGATTQPPQIGSPMAPYPTLGSLLGAAIDNALINRAYAAQFSQALGGVTLSQAVPQQPWPGPSPWGSSLGRSSPPWNPWNPRL